jgi:hypothetical protein
MPNALLFEAFKGRMPAEGHFPRTRVQECLLARAGVTALPEVFSGRKRRQLFVPGFPSDLKSLFSSVSATMLVVRGSCPSCVPWGMYARRQILTSPGSGLPQPLDWPDVRDDDAHDFGVKKRADSAAC